MLYKELYFLLYKTVLGLSWLGLDWAHYPAPYTQYEALGKLLTPVCFCHQVVYFGTGQRGGGDVWLGK